MIRGYLAHSCGDDAFAYPAPVLTDISVSDLAGATHPQAWEGLVDTGAGRTVIPAQICLDLGIPHHDSRRVHGYDRKLSQRLSTYYVRIGVGGIGPLPILAYGAERTSILIGRDILSALVMAIDGKKSTFWIGKPTTQIRTLLDHAGSL